MRKSLKSSLATILLLWAALPACDDQPAFVAGELGLDLLRGPDTGPAPDLVDADLLAPDTVAPAPTINKVQDKGQEGIAVIGEVVYLSGKDFGGGCAVTVGGEKARVLSQSQTDLSFQTPEGIPVGSNAGVLTCQNGAAAFTLVVTRYHLITVPDRDRVEVLHEVTPGDIQKRSSNITFSSPDGIVLSNDSAVAYVATERNLTKTPVVGIIDITAAGGPALQTATVPYTEPVKLPIFGMAAAADAPVLALAVGLAVVFYDITDPLAPKRTGAIQFVSVTPGRALPQILAGFFIDVALTPDGKTAVLLDGAADQIHVYDITTPAKPVALSTKIKVAAGASTKTIVDIPVISGLLGKLKVQGGSAQKLAISADGSTVAVLGGGGFGALVPETFNLDLSNSTLSVFDIQLNAHVNQLESLPKAHFPNAVVYTSTGDAYVSALSSATAQLTKLLLQIGVLAVVGGGSIDLSGIASLLFKNYKDLVSIIEAAWNGNLFDLGGVYRVVNAKAASGAFYHVPYIQAGMCSTYDGKNLLSAGQGWTVKIELGLPQLVKKFEFKYDLGVTVHDLAKTTATKASYKYISLYTWQLKMLLPPWFFGGAGCQQ